MTTERIDDLLESAIIFREALFSDQHEEAFRLFSGFNEGCPALVVDLYAKTIVIHNYADNPEAGVSFVSAAQSFLVKRFAWVNAVVVKTRNSNNPEGRSGRLVYGDHADRKILEDGIWYAIEPTINRDASFYLDTRNIRHWGKQRLKNKSVLNTFAYTGSLGVAAIAGEASRVLQIELNRKFLNVAKTSYALN